MREHGSENSVMVSRTRRNPTLDLFADERDSFSTRPDLSWPAQERVPLNLGRERRVRNAVEADLRASSDPLIVTGFAGLDELIDPVALEQVGHAPDMGGADVWVA